MDLDLSLFSRNVLHSNLHVVYIILPVIPIYLCLCNFVFLSWILYSVKWIDDPFPASSRLTPSTAEPLPEARSESERSFL